MIGSTYEIGERVLVRDDEGVQHPAAVWSDDLKLVVQVISLGENGAIAWVARDRVSRIVLTWEDRALRAERMLYETHRVRHRAGECSFCQAYLAGKLSEGY